MYKLLLPFLLLILTIGAVVVSDRPLPRGDFVYLNRNDVSTLDVSTMSWMQDLRSARLLFEGLVRNDVWTHDYDIRPAVAERWDVSPDGLVYTFHLRRDATWSNGTPVTAHDFIFSWRRSLLPDSAADYFKLFTAIRGAQEFYDWRAGTLATFTRLKSDALGAPASAEGWAGLERALDEAFSAARQGFEASPKEAKAIAPVELSFLKDQWSRSAPELPSRQDLADALWKAAGERFARTVGIEAPDNQTLRVTLARPLPYFMDLVAFPTFAPVYPPLLREHTTVNADDGQLKVEPGWTKPGRLVSNGPFMLTVWRFKRDMRYERNPHYWDPGSVNVDSIVIPSIQDDNGQTLAFRTGTVDWVSDVTSPYRADMLAEKREFYREHQAEYDRLVAEGWDPIEIDRRLPADPRNRIHVFPAFGTYFYNFNCRPTLPDGRANPFHDPRVRRAFALTVDKETITRDVRRTGEPVARTLIPPGSIGGYTSPKGLGFDPVEARRLMAEAGYPDGKGFITVEILFNKDAGHDLIAQVIARNWQEHLGVSVILQQKELKVFRDDLKNSNYMVSRAGWFGDYGDPTTFLDLSRTGDGNNDRKYSSARFDALLDRAQSLTDPAERKRVLTEAETILIEEDFPLVPIFHYVNIYLFDPHRTSGISSHPRSEQLLGFVEMLGDGKGAEEPIVNQPRAGTPAEAQWKADRAGRGVRSVPKEPGPKELGAKEGTR
jgi:oligopeptide transport system substrate-binding protein